MKLHTLKEEQQKICSKIFAKDLIRKTFQTRFYKCSIRAPLRHRALQAIGLSSQTRRSMSWITDNLCP